MSVFVFEGEQEKRQNRTQRTKKRQNREKIALGHFKAFLHKAKQHNKEHLLLGLFGWPTQDRHTHVKDVCQQAWETLFSGFASLLFPEFAGVFELS